MLAHLGDYSVVNITSTLVATYRDTRAAAVSARGRPLSADQIRLEMAVLSAVMKLAATEWQLIPANPCQGVKKPSGTRRERRLELEEEKRLRLALHGRDDGGRLLRFVLVGFYTGMRAGEIAGLRKSEVDLRKRQIRLGRTKNGLPRLIPMSDELTTILRNSIEASPKDSPYVFTSVGKAGAGSTPDRQPDQDKVVYKPYYYTCPWRDTLATAGISGLRFHDLRHEFVSRLFEETQLSDGQIAALTGHEDARSLRRYKHLRAESLRPTIEAHVQDLVQRNVMDQVNEEIGRLTLEALQAESPDWKSIRAVLGVSKTAELRKARQTLRKTSIGKGAARVPRKQGGRTVLGVNTTCQDNLAGKQA